MTFTTRRAALTALACVPALALPALAAGATSTASPDHPDAEIFALIKRRGEVDKLLCAASQAADDLLWAHVGPTRPPNDDFRDRFEAANEHPDVVAAQDERDALNTQWQRAGGTPRGNASKDRRRHDRQARDGCVRHGL